MIVYSYLVHLELPLGQTALLHDIALASPSNANDTLGMKLVDSFQKLIKGMIGVADNKDWTPFRNL